MRLRSRHTPALIDGVVVSSQEALDTANEQLARTKARHTEVQKTARALRLLRENNHFAEQLRIIMVGGHE